MTNYLFPIFCFGLVITGIVLLGIREATDQAKQMAVRNKGISPTAIPPDRDARSRPTNRP